MLNQAFTHPGSMIISLTDWFVFAWKNLVLAGKIGSAILLITITGVMLAFNTPALWKGMIGMVKSWFHFSGKAPSADEILDDLAGEEQQEMNDPEYEAQDGRDR